MACEGCREKARSKLGKVLINEINILKKLLEEKKITPEEYRQKVKLIIVKYGAIN